LIICLFSLFLTRERCAPPAVRPVTTMFLVKQILAFALLAAFPSPAAPPGGALAGERFRVLISTDIGGTDPDDFQSMVHLLLYADAVEIEGLVSSPYGPGRVRHVHQVIDAYATDYANLRSHSANYPSPERLRAVAKQGATDGYGPAGFGASTEGSEWIIRCARRADARPLYVLVWGGIDDLAQSLHDAPDIAPRLRVYFIGGPNKMWSANAYHYIEQHFPKLWFIEANSTYRGWFTGGNQSGEWGNAVFPNTHVAGRGVLGVFFTTLLNGAIKMGDSPSLGYLLRGTPEDPSKQSWGGAFRRVWDGRKTVFTSHTSEASEVEAFGMAEFALPLPPGMSRNHTAQALFDNRVSVQVANDGHRLRFLFSPRDAKVWQYRINSDFAALNGQSGKFTAVPPPPERARLESRVHPNWWIDDPDPVVAEGVHAGAKTVSRWREEFLRDFAARMRRCQTAAAAVVR